ncbi:hypothetical protein M0R72_00855 [Candidatus Pacearchaeota archaeon]|jgi:hypothetical protein|nr:hypothetical protein [Candidatus Pacearchaeota archaeon]
MCVGDEVDESDFDFEPDIQNSPTKPYTLDDRMSVVKLRLEVQETLRQDTRPTTGYSIDERMKCVRLKIETEEQRAKIRYLEEVDRLLQGTRPTKDPQSILQECLTPESWDP